MLEKKGKFYRNSIHFLKRRQSNDKFRKLGGVKKTKKFVKRLNLKVLGVEGRE